VTLLFDIAHCILAIVSGTLKTLFLRLRKLHLFFLTFLIDAIFTLYETLESITVEQTWVSLVKDYFIEYVAVELVTIAVTGYVLFRRARRHAHR